MMKILAIAMLAAAGFLPARSASAVTPKAHVIHYLLPPVAVMMVCNVNGVNYPVDYSSQIWGRNREGSWLIIGQMVYTAYGPVAYSRGGYYPTTC